MNNINIMGRLTAEPELKQTQSGNSVCNFTVAVSRPHVKDKTDFIKCVAWKHTAEFICRYFGKGKMIAVSGILTVRSWKDDNGGNHSISEVLANEVFFCGDKSIAARQEPIQDPEPEYNPEASVYEEDVPF